MSSLFSQSTPVVESGHIEGVVQSVDAERFVCTVKTIKGQRFNSVIWLAASGGSGRASSSSTPKMGDRVLVSTSLGYPIILGCLPRIDRNPTTPLAIDSGTPIADLGKLTPLDGNSFNSSKPGDMVAGDNILASEGGGIVGVLRAGTVLLKASSLAQIMISKLDEGVKVVGRSLDFISEIGSEVSASVKGRVYKWVGLARTPAEARQGLFRYQEFYGDTAAGELLKDNYELGSVGASVPSGGPMRKIMIVNEDRIPVRTEMIDLDGFVNTLTNSPDGAMLNEVNYTSQEWHLKTTSGTVCRIKVTGEEIFITYNEDPTLKLNAEGIFAKTGASEIKILPDSILMDSSGHFVYITPDGVAMG